MSKAKLIELIKMNDHDLEYAIADFTLPEGGLDAFRVVLTQAIKEQDRDTRQGCAESMMFLPILRKDYGFVTIPDGGPWISKDKAYNSCINHQDKDIEGL